MVRAHLDVAVQGPGGGPCSQLQPAAMFTGAAPLSAPYWTPPAQPSQQPTWPGGWDQAALAQSFITMGLTPPTSTEWIADSGPRSTPLLMLVSFLLSDPHTPLVLLLSWLVMGLAFLSPPWVLLLVFLMFLLLLKWFTTFFLFASLLLTTPVLSNLTPLVLL